MTKANVVSGVCEVLWVANECGVTGAVDPKAMKGALGMLADLEEMGLLELMHGRGTPTTKPRTFWPRRKAHRRLVRIWLKTAVRYMTTSYVTEIAYDKNTN